MSPQRPPWPIRRRALRTASEVRDYVAGLPGRVGQLEVLLDDADLLRTLALPEPHEVRIEELTIRVRRWRRPALEWSGTPAYLPNARTVGIELPRGVGEARLSVSFHGTGVMSIAAAALAPVVVVSRQLEGAGFPQLAVGGSVSERALALLPTALPRRIEPIPQDQLHGVGLARAEIGLFGDPERVEVYREGARNPAKIRIRHPFLVQSDGHLAVGGRGPAPILDLHLHNPVGRLQSFDRARYSLRAASTEAGDLELHAVTPRWFEGAQPAPIVVAARAPIDALVVRRLQNIEHVDLGGVRNVGGERDLVVLHRLVELAATGVILHSLSRAFLAPAGVLPVEFLETLRQPYRSIGGLARELRSVAQRREAMRRFGGFFELASSVETATGHRMLPAVSVILSSKRPERAVGVLRAMAAQTYPHVEIMVGVHGTMPPKASEFHAVAKEVGAHVANYPESTLFGEVLADTVRRSSGDLVLKIDDDDFYGAEFVWDLVLAYLYSSADIVGKTTEYLYYEGVDQTVHRRFALEQYHRQMAGGAMMLSRAALDAIGGWRPTPNSTDRSVLIGIANSGGIGYRTQGLGYVYVRHNESHTWAQQDSQLLRGSFEQWPRFVDEIVTG